MQRSFSLSTPHRRGSARLHTHAHRVRHIHSSTHPVHIVFDLKQCVSKLAYFEVVKIIYIKATFEWTKGVFWWLHDVRRWREKEGCMVAMRFIRQLLLFARLLRTSAIHSVYGVRCLVRRVIYIILVKLKIFAYFRISFDTKWTNNVRSRNIFIPIYIGYTHSCSALMWTIFKF